MISSLEQGSGRGEEDWGGGGVVCVWGGGGISFKFNNIVSKENFLDGGLSE